jgi:hypothetical protein
MSKIRLLIYLSLVTISTTTAITLNVFSQTVTNNNANNYSTFPNMGEGQVNNITIIDAVGDIECSRKLHDRIKNDNPTLFIALGDLCYKRDLTNFTTTYNDLKNADKLACVIGNHDSEENGNLNILKQALEYCGDHWYRKVANNSTLLIGLNTNGNITMQSDWGRLLVTNSSFMKGVKNVMLVAHKPGHTPPGSDHDAEDPIVQMFSSITGNITRNIRVFEIAAHNHLMAESSNGEWFISGAGGRKLYNFTADSDWSFINNNDHGYLQITINNTNGSVLSTNFYSLNGKLLN